MPGLALSDGGAAGRLVAATPIKTPATAASMRAELIEKNIFIIHLLVERSAPSWAANLIADFARPRKYGNRSRPSAKKNAIAPLPTGSVNRTVAAKSGPLLPAEHRDHNCRGYRNLRGKCGVRYPEGRVV